jgi:putative oxidoreductase
MDTVIGRFSPQVFVILRIVAGLMFALHGSQKVLGWPPMEGAGGSLPPIAIVAGIIELVTGPLIVIGLFAGWAAFIASGEMAVAYFMGHAPHGWIPLMNKGELAVVYCFVFLYIAAHGAGIWSVDSAIRRRRPIIATS